MYVFSIFNPPRSNIMAANKKTRKEKVIEVLNKARSMELFAIHQ